MEDEVGRTDFALTIRKMLPLDKATWDYLLGNIWVELWEDRPIINKTKDTSEGAEEDAVIETLSVVSDSDPRPDFKSVFLGACKVNTDQWLFDTQVEKTDIH